MFRVMTLRLKELRNERKWTQHHVADLLGVSVPHVSEMERGLKNPSRPLLERMAQVFGVPVADMYETDVSDPAIHSLVEGIKGLSAENRKVVADLIHALSNSTADK